MCVCGGGGMCACWWGMHVFVRGGRITKGLITAQHKRNIYNYENSGTN